MYDVDIFLFVKAWPDLKYGSRILSKFRKLGLKLDFLIRFLSGSLIQRDRLFSGERKGKYVQLDSYVDALNKDYRGG